MLSSSFSIEETLTAGSFLATDLLLLSLIKSNYMKIPIRPKKFNNSLNLITRTPGIRETILDLYRYFFFFLKLIEKVFLIPSVSIV